MESPLMDRLTGIALQAHLRSEHIRGFLTGVATRKGSREDIGQVVTVQDDPNFAQTGVSLGSYVVEITKGESVTWRADGANWATVHDGVTDGLRWFSVDQALIHLIAIRKGDGDTRGTLVDYASRLIGFNDVPDWKN